MQLRQKKVRAQTNCYKNSEHHAFWIYSLNFLKNMYFVDKVTGNKKNSVPSLKNWIHTVESIQNLWKLVSQKYGFSEITTDF